MKMPVVKNITQISLRVVDVSFGVEYFNFQINYQSGTYHWAILSNEGALQLSYALGISLIKPVAPAT